MSAGALLLAGTQRAAVEAVTGGRSACARAGVARGWSLEEALWWRTDKRGALLRRQLRRAYLCVHGALRGGQQGGGGGDAAPVV